MQRTLVMVRHAKSSWANPLQSDFERPLNDRGERDAPRIGTHLKKLGLQPDLIISSTARRAAQTAQKIAAAIGYDESRIQWLDKLYHCIPAVFEEVIRELDDHIGEVFIVAHNPGITDFVNQLSPEFSIDNMPTCGVAAARLETDSWSDFNQQNKKVFLFEYPRKIS